jgi:hypothetical protein
MSSFNLNNNYPKPAWYRGSAVADQRLAVTTAVVQFAAFADTSTMVVLDVQTADVMCTFDGSDPSPTNGHLLYNGTQYTWSTAAAQQAKFHRRTTTDGVIHASEFQV